MVSIRSLAQKRILLTATSLANRDAPKTTACLSPLANTNVRSLNRAVVPPPSKFTPRPDQITAVNKVNEGFQKNKRGKLILPCGTGKTVTGLWIKEKENAKTTIVAVPSIALIKQTKDVWQAQKTKDFDYLCICSDKDVDTKEGDSITLKPEELDQDTKKVTTDVDEIKAFLTKKSKNKVIYTTYQSLPKLIEANKQAKVRFDLALIDEAHKTTGRQGDLFTLIHDNKNLNIDKRLYMTATPKITSESDDGEFLADMSNENIYGPEFHRMSFGEAIQLGILSDYHVIAVGVTEDELRDKVINHSQDSSQYKDLVNNVALEKVMQQYNANHALSFHSKVNQAEAFKNAHSKLFPQTLSLHVNGKQGTRERVNTLERFAKIQAPNKALITNAKCLTEGVDIPSIDLVYFCDPKSSTIDIVQAAGRAFRKNKSQPNKVGYIVIPILHKPGEEVANVVSSSSFKNTVRILQALGSADERLVAKLCLREKSKDSDSKEPEPEDSDSKEPGPEISIFGIEDQNLSTKIFSTIIDRTANRLKPLLYNDFTAALNVIKAKQANRPSNAVYYFQSQGDNAECGLIKHIGVGFIALKTLAKKAKLATDQTTPTQLADLIWGELKKPEDFDSALKTIKTKQPGRPSNAWHYFGSIDAYAECGLIKHIGIGFIALKKLTIKAKKANKQPTVTQLADLIWGELKKPEDFDSALKTIKTKQPDKPSNTSYYFESQGDYAECGLIKHIGIGFKALKLLAITAELATCQTTHTQLADLIWGELKKPKDFDSTLAAIKTKQPNRPSNAFYYFNSLFDYTECGLKQHIDIGFKALRTLAIKAGEANENTTLAQLADLIWG